MRTTELDLSPAARLCLEVADIYEVDRLLEHGTGGLIQRPEFSKGAELYEIVRELHRRGVTFSRPGGHLQGERELEMFRLRVVVGLSLDEIAERFNLTRGRVHQLLRLHFRLDAVPPATRAHRPQATCHRPHTLKDRHRLYLLARVAIKRYYRRPITVEDVAKALASSPRQLQRVYSQFSDSTFHEDLTADGWTPQSSCYHGPRSPCKTWRAGSDTASPRTSPARFDAATAYHHPTCGPSRAAQRITTASALSYS
jgi:Sigma-70, region 4